MVEVRVRTWNIASERPSEWSDVFKVGEPLEGSRRPSEEKRGVEKSGASKTDVLRAAREEEKAVLKKTKSTVEGGLATVIQLGTDEQFMVKHTMTGVAHMEAQGWSAFRRAIGGLLIEMGVYGGCEGRLFDFSAEDLEGLVSHGDDPKLHVAKPLFSLATIGGYVLQTLSQHAVVETEAWVRLASEIAMLVDLASATEEEEVTRPMVSWFRVRVRIRVMEDEAARAIRPITLTNPQPSTSGELAARGPRRRVRVARAVRGGRLRGAAA